MLSLIRVKIFKRNNSTNELCLEKKSLVLMILKMSFRVDRLKLPEILT